MTAILRLFHALAASALSLLPDSPFAAFLEELETIPYLGYLNYFVPVSDFLVLLGIWGAAVSVFYAASAILRFVKAIQ